MTLLRRLNDIYFFKKIIVFNALEIETIDFFNG